MTKGVRSTIPRTPSDSHLVSVPVVMPGVFRLFLRLVHDCRLGGARFTTNVATRSVSSATDTYFPMFPHMIGAK